jgi:glycosyltransferase involved in cell wall biosynthesis
VVKFSIITINLNNKIGLEKTIKSVISQNLSNFEYIIVDGKSIDGSAEILNLYSKSINIIISEKDGGIYEAMNKGIQNATGDYLLFLNSGDVFFSSDVLSKVSGSNLQSDLIIGKIKIAEIVHSFPSTLTKFFFLQYGIAHPSTFIKRELFLKFGLYNQENKITSDWEFFFKVLFKFKSSYNFIGIIVADFDPSGISSNPYNSLVINSEKRNYIKKDFPILYLFYYVLYHELLRKGALFKRIIYNKFYLPVSYGIEKIRSFFKYIIRPQYHLDKEKLKIGFAILSYERPGYLEKCLDSLYKSDFSNLDVTILISDDGSKNPLVKQIINKSAPESLKVVRYFSEKGPNNAGAAINKAMNYLLQLDDFDLIGWGDSDCLFHKMWLQKTLDICLSAISNHKLNQLGPFTSFNSSDILFHKLLGEYNTPSGKYLVKRQAGMLNYLMLKEDWLKIGPFEESEDDETIMTLKLEKLGIRNLSTFESFVEHIGQDSILNTWRPTKIERAVSGLNLTKELGWPIYLNEIDSLGYYKYVKDNNHFGEVCTKNGKNLDILICATKKDLSVLGCCIKGLYDNLKHPIGKIFIVAPSNLELDLLKALYPSIIHLNEDEILPITRLDIDYVVNGQDRSGWLFQQLLKLSVDQISDSENVLIIDADTVLVSPQLYEFNGKNILLISDEFHKPYFDVYTKLTGELPSTLLSSVSHSLLINRKHLIELKKHIADLHLMEWWQAIISKTDKLNSSGFSEYELYGQWVLNKYPEYYSREYFFNKSIKRKYKMSQNVFRKYIGSFRSVSLHSYL